MDRVVALFHTLLFCIAARAFCCQPPLALAAVEVPLALGWTNNPKLSNGLFTDPAAAGVVDCCCCCC